MNVTSSNCIQILTIYSTFTNPVFARCMCRSAWNVHVFLSSLQKEKKESKMHKNKQNKFEFIKCNVWKSINGKRFIQNPIDVEPNNWNNVYFLPIYTNPWIAFLSFLSLFFIFCLEYSVHFSCADGYFTRHLSEHNLSSSCQYTLAICHFSLFIYLFFLWVKWLKMY